MVTLIKRLNYYHPEQGYTFCTFTRYLLPRKVTLKLYLKINHDPFMHLNTISTCPGERQGLFSIFTVRHYTVLIRSQSSTAEPAVFSVQGKFLLWAWGKLQAVKEQRNICDTLAWTVLVLSLLGFFWVNKSSMRKLTEKDRIRRNTSNARALSF